MKRLHKSIVVWLPFAAFVALVYKPVTIWVEWKHEQKTIDRLLGLVEQEEEEPEPIFGFTFDFPNMVHASTPCFFGRNEGPVHLSIPAEFTNLTTPVGYVKNGTLLDYLLRANRLDACTFKSETPVSEVIETVAALKHLRVIHLDFSERELSLEDLNAFRTAPFIITMLDLSNSGITDKDLSQLARIPGLQGLRLDGNPITDVGLKHLQNHPTLYRLSLSKTEVTNDGLPVLSTVSNLCELSLADLQVSETGLVWLSGLRAIRTLDISGTPTSSHGLSFIREMNNLQELNISGTAVFDTGSQHVLAAMFQGPTPIPRNVVVHLSQLERPTITKLRSADIDVTTVFNTSVVSPDTTGGFDEAVKFYSWEKEQIELQDKTEDQIVRELMQDSAD